MPVTLLTTTFLAATELAINNVLTLDTTSQNKLTKLDGSVLSVTCTSPRLDIFIIVRGQTLSLNSYYEQTPNTRIKGTASALFKLLIAKDKNQAFYNDDIDISGSLELVQALQDILLNLNIDWEYHLSNIIGDIPTEAFSTSLSKSESFINNTHDSLLMDIDEYIHEEKKLFPSANELKNFYQSIDHLRLDIDRVEAKLKRLKQNSQ